MMISGRNIRHFERLPASGELLFSFSRIELGKKRDITSRAEIVNTSEGGLCIKTSTPLEVGNILTLDLGGQKQKAMVKWVLREEGIYLTGLMFTKK